MRIWQRLKEREQALLDRWRTLITESYPKETSLFLQKKKNQFANPVGHNIRKVTQDLVSIFLSEEEIGAPPDSLLNFVKIRAVQEFSAAQAVGFVFFLKQAVRELLEKEKDIQVSTKDWFDVDHRIDYLALVTFDAYVVAREKLFNIRIRELKTGAYHVMNGTSPFDQDDKLSSS